MHPFSLGQEYRRAALLEFLGSGQEMPGVLWGPREPGCVICTSGGRHGKKAGYSDGQQQDGSWIYVGQGRTGDQRLKNSANAKLAARDRSVLFFTTRELNAKEKAQHGHAKFYVFRGAFNVAGFEFFSPDEGSRKGDRLIRFFLFPADDGYAASPEPGLVEASGAQPSLASLQATLLGDTSTAKPTRISMVEYRARSAAVHRYALARAGGICECCDSAAPFESDAGIPYLEVHHLLRLADDGPDIPVNVAAVCPNCHRALHLSAKRAMHASTLLAKIREREEAVRLSGARQ